MVTSSAAIQTDLNFYELNKEELLWRSSRIKFLQRKVAAFQRIFDGLYADWATGRRSAAVQTECKMHGAVHEGTSHNWGQPRVEHDAVDKPMKGYKNKLILKQMEVQLVTRTS